MDTRKVMTLVGKLLGTRENYKKTYCIKTSYHSRGKYMFFDDTPLKDEWQLEVYLFAQKMMQENKFKSVIDVGCGSGYKLLKYLGQYDTMGLEVSPTYEWLLEKFPHRRWIKSDFNTNKKLSTDLVISSDIIEHLEDPDKLLDFVNRIECKSIIFSTPSRDLLYRFWNWGYWGPPRNKHHVREWSFNEFRQYLSLSFEVIFHTITNREQCTQMVVCKKKSILG